MLNESQSEKQSLLMNQFSEALTKESVHTNTQLRQAFHPSAKSKLKSIPNVVSSALIHVRSLSFSLSRFCSLLLYKLLSDKFIFCGVEKWFLALEFGLHSNYFLGRFFSLLPHFSDFPHISPVEHIPCN